MAENTKSYVLAFVVLSVACSVILGRLTLGGYKVDVDQISGRLKLTRPDGKMVKLTPIKVWEVDKFGDPVSDPSHSVSEDQLAKLNFTISDPCKKLIPSSSVNARYFCIHSEMNTPSSKAVYTTEVYFVTDSKGHIVEGDVSTKLTANQIVLKMIVAGWEWCTSCGKFGEYLQLDLRIDLPDGRTPTPEYNTSRISNFLLGNDTRLSLPKLAKLDESDDLTALPIDYPPQLTADNGGKHILHIRLPKFDHKVVYGPILDLDINDNIPIIDADKLPACSSGKPPAPSPSPSKAAIPPTMSRVAMATLLGLVTFEYFI